MKQSNPTNKNSEEGPGGAQPVVKYIVIEDEAIAEDGDEAVDETLQNQNTTSSNRNSSSASKVKTKTSSSSQHEYERQHTSSHTSYISSYWDNAEISPEIVQKITQNYGPCDWYLEPDAQRLSMMVTFLEFHEKCAADIYVGGPRLITKFFKSYSETKPHERNLID